MPIIMIKMVLNETLNMYMNVMIVPNVSETSMNELHSKQIKIMKNYVENILKTKLIKVLELKQNYSRKFDVSCFGL